MADDAFPFDFFVSRRGSVAGLAREVADVLEAAGHRVVVQDYDFSRGGDFVADIHQALKTARHLMILHTADYDTNIWTQKEFSNFLAAALPSAGARRVCVLRCDGSLPSGLLHNVVFGDLIGVADPAARQQIILATAHGEPLARRRDPIVFGPATMPGRNAFFTGREDLLAAMRRSLVAGTGATALTQAAVHGLGGVGKTSLAREYVERFASDYAGIWWITATGREAVLAGLADLAARLDNRWEEATELELAARAALAVIERASGLPFLLVYDNVPSPDVLEGLLPARGAHLVLTSRWAEWGGRAHELAVAELPEDAAVAFLLARTGRDDRTGALRLARVLGCLPLALDHAGAYVKLSMVGFDAYTHDVERLIRREVLDPAYPRSVAATFELAITAASQRFPGAATLLEALAYLAPDDIPLDLLDDTVLPATDRDEAVMALALVSLIRIPRVPAATATISLHRLVSAVIRGQIAASDRVTLVLAGTIERLATAFPGNGDGEIKQWPRCQVLLPHVQSADAFAQAEKFDSPRLCELLSNAGLFATGRGLRGQAEIFAQRAVEIGERAFAPDHPDFVTLLSNLAGICADQGRFEEAESLTRSVLANEERILGSDHWNVLKSKADLGWLVFRQGRLIEAERMLRDALANGERVLGREDPDVLMMLNNLALVLQSQGRLYEAEPLVREALAVGERVLGQEHSRVMLSLNNLALILQSQGRYAEAEPLLRDALAGGERVLGHEHPDVLLLLINLAAALQGQGRLDEAEPLLREALAVGERVLGREHPDVLRTLNNLALVLQNQGRHAEAEPLLSEALAVGERALGRDHPDVWPSLINMAGVLESQGRLDEAEAVLREALAIGERVVGREHPNVLKSQHNLAFILQRRGRLDEAELLLREALTGGERVLGREHPDMLLLLINLAGVLRGKGLPAEAEPLLREALTKGERVLGGEHPHMLLAQNNLAMVLQDQGLFDQAEQLFRKALTGGDRGLGPEHPGLLQTQTNLAGVLREQGRLAEAEALFRDTLTVGSRVLGREHRTTLATLNSLAGVLQEQGQLAEAEPLIREALTIGERVLGRQHAEVRRYRARLVELEQQMADIASKKASSRWRPQWRPRWLRYLLPGERDR